MDLFFSSAEATRMLAATNAALLSAQKTRGHEKVTVFLTALHKAGYTIALDPSARDAPALRQPSTEPAQQEDNASPFAFKD